MSIIASNNPFPHDPDDNFKDKLDRGGYEGTAQDLKNQIEALANPDAFLSVGVINKVGNDITIAANQFSWRIDQLSYVNADFATTIIAATEGYRRIDIIVATKFGTFVKIQGEESIDSVQEPATPAGTLRLTFFNVFGAEVDEPPLPVTDITKLDKDGYTGTAQTLSDSIELEKTQRIFADATLAARTDNTENLIEDLENEKVDKITGKGLSTEDYTSSEKTKVGFITITQSVNLDDIETRVNELDAAIVIKGTWSAATGVFPGSGLAQAGWSYLVTTDGTVDGVEFKNGDRLICVLDNASTSTYSGNWYKADYTDRVNTVAGRTGNVTITSSDLSDFNTAVNSLITAALSGYAKKYGTRTVLSGTAIDWSTDTEVYTKTLSANTTFTDTNLPSGTNTRTITLSITGAYTLTFPAYWKHKGGTYNPAKTNQIVLQCVDGGSGTERVNYIINPDL